MKRASINWEHVKSRLRASEQALQEALAESPARIDAVYRQRAARLAEKQATQGPVTAGLPVLIFRLAQERYAIELQEVAETIPFTGCSPAPGSPPQFRGVIGLRGELRPVLDLGRLLALAENGNRNSGFVLLLRGRGREIGLKVDHVEELREIRPEELSGPGQVNYVKGITPDALMLLNVEAVLTQVFSKEESLPK
jgi:chemotaxis signal transduction protein